VLFTVPDQAVAGVAAKLVAQLPLGVARVHCAGALNLDTLGEPARHHPRGSLHPLCAVSNPSDLLVGAAATVEADSRALQSRLMHLARAIELRPIPVRIAKRSSYHAGAVLCAGGTVALLASGIDALVQAGLTQAQAQQALLPMMRSALERVERQGLSRGLTGPLVRGDWEVVAGHLSALKQPARELYRLLAQRSLALLSATAPSRERLHRLLRPK
jgi:predicted short-subunit dehydrogenase-like oxidoreductase (DUF2520 family)